MNEDDRATTFTLPELNVDSLTLVCSTLETAMYGAVVVSAEGTIVSANRAVEAIFAYSASELVGQPLECLLTERLPGYPELVQQFWMSPQDRMITSRWTLAGLRKDKVPVPLEISVNAIAQGDLRFVVVSFIDITERVDLEARLVAATHEHLGFQRLVADIAAQFAAVEVHAVDETIVNSLRQIGEALQLDRAMLWRKEKGEAVAVATHYWAVPPDTSAPEPFPAVSIPWVVSKLAAGEACWFKSVDDLPDPVDRETFRRQGPRSSVMVPLTLEGHGSGVLGALTLSSMMKEHEWVPAVVERLRLLAGVISQALERKASQLALRNALDEINQLRDRLTAENVQLRHEVKMARTSSRLIVSESAAVKRAIAQIEQVAPTPSTVLLLGETGAGKEVFAQAIHDLSPRHQRSMVRVSCGAIPSALIESELFGRERGAYTGALSRQIGRFEVANQSTLFLDEIGELQPEVQVKLLRVLQERVIERLGSSQPVKVDVRIIAATNRDLEKAVADNLFREDLFYRLNVFPIVVPPLRERVEDIPGLVWAFIDELSRLFGKSIESVSKDSLRELERYSWPGNVRELRNLIERAVILSTGHHLVVPAPKPAVSKIPQAAMTLAALEIEHIRNVLESTNWRVRGAGGAAERLGLKPTTLESRMARLGITRKKAS